MTQESLTEKLSNHLLRPVDDASRYRARLHLLDWLGCVAGARRSEQAQRFGRLIPYPQHWFGNILEMDDIHRTAILHPGPVIWPAALYHAKDMDDLLDSSVRGYEAAIAIGSTFDAHHYAHWHPTSTAGIFGAAIAHLGGMIALGQDSKEICVSALGLAGTASAGLWQTRHEGDDAKQFHVARAIETGASIASWALNNVKGSRFILEGPQGLYAATCKDPKPLILPDQWRIHEVSIKPWGACRHAHPAIDAALMLRKKQQFSEHEIHVETYADAIIFCDRPNPETVNDAKFSLQHAVAIVVERGVPELADFEPDAIAAMADARARVTVSKAADITERYPEHYGARISCGDSHVELVDTLGDPERPLSDDGVIEKAVALIAWGGLPEKEARRAVDLALKGNDPAAIGAMLADWLS